LKNKFATEILFIFDDFRFFGCVNTDFDLGSSKTSVSALVTVQVLVSTLLHYNTESNLQCYVYFNTEPCPGSKLDICTDVIAVNEGTSGFQETNNKTAAIVTEYPKGGGNIASRITLL